MVRLLLFATICATLLCVRPALADDATGVYESTEAALDAHEREVNPETAGGTAQEVISQFFPEVEEDEGTYPASEFLEHDFLLRRQGPAKGSYSGRVFTKYSEDKISNVTKWEKELELYLNYKDVSSYLRFGDVNAFAGTNDDFRWQKGNIRFKHDSGAVTTGSYGALFGRGLALNMFEERFLDFDNEIEGLKIQQEVGEGELTALWGRRKDQAQFNQSEVSALRWHQPLGDAIEVGAHTVHVRFPTETATIDEPNMLDYNLVGGEVTVRAGDVNLFAETVRLERDAVDYGISTFDFEGIDGTGTYAAATYAVPGFAATLEYKDYKGLTQPFSVLPPVRQWEQNRTAVPDDDKGFGLDLNLAPWDDGSHISLHATRENNHAGNRIYREFLLSYGGPTDQRTTYVAELWWVNQEGEKFQQRRLTLNQRLDSDWTASAFIERKKVDLFGLLSTDWIYIAEANYGSKLLLSTQLATTSAPSTPDHWLLYEARYLPTEDHEIHLLLGSRREAFVCSGGICRLEPAFDGVRVDWLFRF